MSNMAFTFNTPAGIAGSVTRPLDSSVESVQLNSATSFGAFGMFGIFVDGLFVPVVTSSVGTDVKGLLVRSVPSIAGNLTATFNQAVPNADYVQGRLTRGYANVICTIGTPVKGGAVYVRTVAATGKAIGDIEATSDTNKNVIVPNCEFATSGKDANNIAEIFIKVS